MCNILALCRGLLLGLLCLAAIQARGWPRANHVLIISIDGGKPSEILRADMPILKRLVAEGASTWQATTIFPSLTLPSHASMLTGVAPAKHKILWNDWEPQAGTVRVATVFSEAKAQGFSTAMFVGKEKFRHLARPGTVDRFSYPAGRSHEVLKPSLESEEVEQSSSVASKVVAGEAAQYLRSKKPNLCFIHLTDPDDAGHEHGWGSAQQLRAFQQVDAALGTILKALEEAAILDESVVMITADHGGHGREHGLDIPEDMIIPWIAWGKNVKRDFVIKQSVTTCDTAATTLWLLDIDLPGSLDGKPLVNVFDVRETTQAQAGGSQSR